MYGAILEKGEQYYTDLSRMFSEIEDVQKNYSSLLSVIVIHKQTICGTIIERILLDKW